MLLQKETTAEGDLYESMPHVSKALKSKRNKQAG